MQAIRTGTPASLLYRHMGKYALVLLIIALNACQSPTTNTVSYDELLLPEIQGVLHRSGEALAGVVIRVSRNEGVRSVCERPLAEVVTDQQGMFRLQAVSKKQAAAVPDRIENDWQVCMLQDDRVRQIWFDRHVGVLIGGQLTQLDCNLEDARAVGSAFCKPGSVDR